MPPGPRLRCSRSPHDLGRTTHRETVPGAPEAVHCCPRSPPGVSTMGDPLTPGKETEMARGCAVPPCSVPLAFVRAPQVFRVHAYLDLAELEHGEPPAATPRSPA